MPRGVLSVLGYISLAKAFARFGDVDFNPAVG